jgi:hypothetical protein
MLEEKEMEMATEKARQRGWMLVKLAVEEKTEDVAKAIWKANEADWLKTKDTKVKLGCVSRADVVRLDVAMAKVLGCKQAIVVPVALKDGVTPEDAIKAIGSYAGQGAEVFWMEVLAHNPGIVEKADDRGAQAQERTALTFYKEEPGTGTPPGVIEGRNAWG